MVASQMPSNLRELGLRRRAGFRRAPGADGSHAVPREGPYRRTLGPWGHVGGGVPSKVRKPGMEVEPHTLVGLKVLILGQERECPVHAGDSWYSERRPWSLHRNILGTVSVEATLADMLGHGCWWRGAGGARRRTLRSRLTGQESVPG